MSETAATESAAEETTGEASTESTETRTETTAEVRDPAKLLSAYEAEKGKRREEAEARRKLQTDFDALTAKVEGKEAEYQAAQKAREVEQAAMAKANDQILRYEIRLAAKGVLADPADALRFLDLSTLEVGADGEVDGQTVTDAIANLIKDKPYLAAQGGKRFQGSADGGARSGSQPAQLSRADLKGMSPEAIEKARVEGRLNDALGIS